MTRAGGGREGREREGGGRYSEVVFVRMVLVGRRGGVGGGGVRVVIVGSIVSWSRALYIERRDNKFCFFRQSFVTYYVGYLCKKVQNFKQCDYYKITEEGWGIPRWHLEVNTEP